MLWLALATAGCAVAQSAFAQTGEPLSPSTHGQAVSLAREGRLHEALSLLEQERLKGLLAPEALADYIRILAWNQDCEKAVRVAEFDAEPEQLPAGVLLEVARCARKTGQMDRAVSYYRRLVPHEPDNASFIMELARALFDAGRLDEVRTLLEVRMSGSSVARGPVALLALAAAEQRRWPDAFAMKRRAEAAAPAGAEDERIAAEDLAAAARLVRDAAAELARDGQYEQALALLRELDGGPSVPIDAAYDAVAINTWAQRYQEAVAAYEPLLPSAGRLPPYVLRAAAKAYWAIGHSERAAELYERILAGAPDDTDARQGAFQVAVDLGHREEAVRHLDALRRAFPGRPDYTHKHIELLWQLGRRDEALAALIAVQDPGLALDRFRDVIRLIPADVLIERWLPMRRAIMQLDPQYAASITEALLLMQMHDQGAVPLRDVDQVMAWLRAGAPAYPVLLRVEVAKFFLDHGRTAEAEELFNAVMAAEPSDHDPDVRLGRARLFLLYGAYPEAAAAVEEVLEREPMLLEALFVKGELLEAQEERLKALDIYDKILAREPGHAAAMNVKIRALMDLGANSLALELLRQMGDRADPVLVRRARANAAMYAIRWNESPQAIAALQEIDASMTPTQPDSQAPGGLDLPTRDQVMRDTVRYLGDLQEEAAPARRRREVPPVMRQRWDHILALRLQRRLGELLQAYEALEKLPAPPPPWVRLAAAESYLYFRQPKKALKVYEQVVREQPTSFEARMGLFHTLLELRKFRKAERVLEALDRETPVRVLEHGILRDNWRKAEIAYGQGWLLVYQDRLAEADVYFAGLLRRAPFNTTIRTAMAHTHLWRSWPRRAVEDFQVIRAIEPESVAAGNGYCLALNAVGKKQEARELNRELLAKDPTNAHLLRTKRQFDVEQMRTVQVDAVVTNEHPGDEEVLIKVRGEQPVGYQASVFAEWASRFTAQSGDDDVDQRGYVGATLDLPPVWRLTAAASAEADTGEEWGAVLGARAKPDDHWTFQAEYDSKTLEIPLRSRSNDVQGSLADFSVEYRLSELWSTALGASLRHLDDGNETTTVTWTTDSALTTRANWKTRLGTELSASFNSDQTVAYYSPDRVMTAYLIPMVEHTWFRRYESALVDRVSFGLGRAWQNRFAGQTVWFLRYEQDWRFSDVWQWLIGLIYGQRNYDGEDVNALTAYSTMRVKF